jgi:putative ATP-dependent endonuclease of OLD family
VRITRVLLDDFRGWEHLDLRPAGHVLLAGVPRAGRSDLLAALVRVIDPSSIRVQPSLADIRQTVTGSTLKKLDGPTVRERRPAGASVAGGSGLDEPQSAAGGDTGDPANARRTEVAGIEVTLVDLDPELEQLCDGYLEPQDSKGQASEETDADPAAPLCVRIAYRVSYDQLSDTLEQVVYFPVRSNLATSQYSRVPAVVRHALPVVVLSTARPLQLRGEGTLRRLLADRDPEAAAEAFGRLREAVHQATAGLSAESVIIDAVNAVLSAGGSKERLSDDDVDASRLRFQAEDGSLTALLRAVQPSLHLDNAGFLPLASHGSTATAVLSAAEALLLTQTPGAVVLADDFGDQLDSATAEHLAAMLRAGAGQLWLSSRRSEVARGFEPHELVRLTRHGGVRAVHALIKATDRKALAVLRQLHTQLLPAFTSPTIAIVEGPHDVATYALADRRRTPLTLPLSAHGVRMVSADNGSGGGTSQIPRVARLAQQLGFRVLGLIDGDKETPSTAEVLAAIEEACDVVVRLPEGIAVEGAIVAGIHTDLLRAAASALPEYGIPDPTVTVDDDHVAQSLRKPLHNHGLHEPFLEALIPDAGVPPLIRAALDALAVVSNPAYNGPTVITLAMPPGADTQPVSEP